MSHLRPFRPDYRPEDKVIMTVERGERPLSPVHVHVDDHTPVHVHVKKPKKPSLTEMSDAKTSGVHSGSNLRRSTATTKAKSKPGAGGPWVPPPAKSSKGSKYLWQGPSHRLEITPQDAETVQSTLRVTDLSTDDEDRVTTKMRRYEKKIDSLMTEVGSLKNEVDLERSLRELNKQDDLLETSRKLIERQEYDLQEYKHELSATEVENRILRRNMDRLKDEASYSRTEKEQIDYEREQLMKKLVEVEMDGQAASKQVAALRDTIRRLREEKRMSESDGGVLSKQKELLMERLSDFESTNHALRRMLRERHEQEATGLRLSEQRDLLLGKLSETEDTMQRQRADILERDRQIADLRRHIDAQKEENMTISGIQTSLESTRGHLQKQLRQKEGDCNRMAVQIRSIESQLAQERIEVDHLQELLAGAKEKADRDKEALKKATRVQKQRATKSEDALEHLNVQLLERENIIAENRSEMDSYRALCDKVSKEKSQISAENSALKTRIAELENIMLSLEDDAKAKVETATSQLHLKSTESATLKLENERLKTSLATIEDKLVQADNEVSQLRGNLRQYETLVEEYRTQMNRSRREADDTMVQLEEQKLETSRVMKEGEIELDTVKCRLQARLLELEPIPELLKSTELKLQDSNEQLLNYERKNTENTKLIAELSSKVEQQAGHMQHMKDKWQMSQDDSRNIGAKLEAVERKLFDIENQNRELLTTVAKREEAVHQTTLRLDEKTRENESLTRQLEVALTDARRQSEQARDKTAAKERSCQGRILDLESQLSQCRAEVARAKREKEEAERKFNSRLYDLKDRLEQSHSTNRSMQNYVQFLKNSYANVFGDTSMTTSSPVRHSTYH